MSQFKIGDVVKLKSGGPKMTVDCMRNNRYSNCCWFDAFERLEKADFSNESLELYISPVKAIMTGVQKEPASMSEYDRKMMAYNCGFVSEAQKEEISRSNLKGEQLLSDYDILTKWLKYSPEEARKIINDKKLER